MDFMTTLFLIRHAPVHVDFNTTSTTWCLSEEGTQLAERLAQLRVFHDLAVVYSSPEPKAIATGQPLATRFAVPLVEHPGLAELHRGQNNIVGLERAVKRHNRRYKCNELFVSTIDTAITYTASGTVTTTPSTGKLIRTAFYGLIPNSSRSPRYWVTC